MKRIQPMTVATFAVGILASTAGASAQTATREKVESVIPRIESMAEQLIDEGQVPGLAIGVVFGDEVVYLGGFGVREIGKPEMVDADTVFQIASLSKAVSSTVVAAIVSGGTAAWDSRIADIDPGFQLYDAYPTANVTIRDLFSHRSGLPGEAGNELEELGFDRDTILHRLRLVPPASSFRSAYSYSNFGLTEGGVAAAKTIGMSWEDAAKMLLYDPLGMASTSSRYADFVNRQNRATLHAWYEGRWQALTKRIPDPQAPAGGVSSSVRDLVQWMRLELAGGRFDGKQLIAADAIAETHQPVMARGLNTVTGAPSFYGLGWDVSYGRHGLLWGHAGAFSVGSRTVVNLLPESDIGIVVLANAFPTGVPEAVADTLLDLVFDGAPSRDWLKDWNAVFEGLFAPMAAQAKETYGTPPASASPALASSAYVGTYANDYFGEAIVAEEAAGLVVKLGPGGAKTFPLTHFDRDLFLYYPVPEWPDLPVAVTFVTGPDQWATQVTFDDLNGLGLGVFPRVAE